MKILRPLAGAATATLLLVLLPARSETPMKDRPAAEERLSFQSFAPWSARTHINADVAMVYGIDKTLPARIKTWKDKGYRVHVMTGVAWGEYQDYLYGRFDGVNHEDEAQTDRNGKKIGHGGDVYYMSPGPAYGRFLSAGVGRALDAGADAIHLEEPEFWVRGGYEEGFKREWKAFYKEDWQPPHTSPDAQYRASKLKYFLYRRALSDVFAFVKEYGRQHSRTIPCYVPTHSLINYAQWGIVSPESSLLSVGCDGYIAQVWTGTARTPNVYEGRLRERTFETAFLEYGAMQNLVRASGPKGGPDRRVWYLNDPVEDNANHSWIDYRTNWESTLTASLLQPDVWRYEVLPWPDRIFTGKYPAGEGEDKNTRVGIPAAYATELQAVFRALGDMKQPPATVRWEKSGTPRGVGILVSDTMMFQRGEPLASDPHLGSFYGLAMPLVKYGLPTEAVQMERTLDRPDFLKPYRVLLLTYEGQKPPTPAVHDALAAWVRAGGALVVVDDDRDPYNAVRDWWNTPPLAWKTPREALFATLGLPPNALGSHQVGKGLVLRVAESPARLAGEPNGANAIRQLVRDALASTKGAPAFTPTNAFVLRRGPYVVASGLDESVSDQPPATLHGRFVNLFDADLPVVTDVRLEPGRRALLVDLDKFPKTSPRIVAAACRVTGETVTRDALRFRASGIADTNAVVRILLPAPPHAVFVNNQPLPADRYDYENNTLRLRTLRLRFPNTPDGVTVEVRRQPAR